MRVTFVSKSSRAIASRRYRVDAVTEELIKHGIMASATKSGTDEDTLRVYGKHFDFTEYDDAVWFRRGGKKVIFDVCDDHMSKDGPVKDHYIRMCEMADLVVCATRRIESVVREYVPEATLVVIPDMVLGDRVRHVHRLRRAELLWYGHPSNLESLFKWLPHLATYHLEIVCAPLPDASQIPHKGQLVLTQWSEEVVKEALSRADVTVVPRREGPEGEAKGANRVLESIWAGVPVWAEENDAIIEAQHLGCIGAESILFRPGEVKEQMAWLDSLDKTPMLEAAQANIAKHYSPEVIGRKWAEVVELVDQE